MNIGKRPALGFRMLVIALALGVSASALAQPYGYDCGPGMMGPGMMGPGMMGPGMMGPGMMGGSGMHHGMMMGAPGMWGPYSGLNLTDEQNAKVATAQDELSKKQWDIMGQVQDEQFKLQQLYSAPTRDSAAINEQFNKIRQLRQQLWNATAEAQKKMEGVLTKEQRNQMSRQGGRWGWR